MKYAVNFDPDKSNCFEEKLWNTADPAWTEEILTNDVYQCQIVECPYSNAILSDFEFDKECIVFNEEKYKERVEKKRLENLRNQRQPLLNAWDKYNVLVMREIITETSEQLEEVKEWYFKLLEMDGFAISNPPNYIKDLL